VSIILLLNFDQIVILKGTSFLEEHKKDISMTSRITRCVHAIKKTVLLICKGYTSLFLVGLYEFFTNQFIKSFCPFF
jgi:hypothetical protein